MRCLSLLVLAALCLPSVAVAQGTQAAAAPSADFVTVAQDPNLGDVMASAAGQPSQAVPDADTTVPYLDLVSLAVQERQEDIAVRLAVAGVASPAEAPFAASCFYLVTFRAHDVVYAVQIMRSSVTGQSVQYFAALLQQDPNTLRYTALLQLPVTVDAGATPPTLTVLVPRQSLLDTHGASPYPGIPFDGFHARSSSVAENIGLGFGRLPVAVTSAGSRPITLGDRMPDTGNGTGIPITIGVTQNGHATLTSDDPVRSSNGEATTFVYKVTLRNIGDKPDRFTLAARSVPGAWQVTLPGGVLQVGAQQNTTFPVLVTVPFAHLHGSFSKFSVEAQSQSDPGTTGRIEIGIRYTLIPQPTGHHPVVWFHGANQVEDPTLDTACQAVECGVSQVYMNAIETDPAITDPTKEPTVPSFLWYSGTCLAQCDPGFETAAPMYKWFVPLQPALQVGVDLDMHGQGDIKWPIGSTLPLTGAKLSGQLVRYGPARPGDNRGNGNSLTPSGNATVIARIDPKDPVDVAAQGTAVLEGTITPLPGGDYIPYEKGAALELEVNVTVQNRVDFGGVNDSPYWARGGQMELPLMEYHDPLSEAFSIPVLSLSAEGPVERAVNPGKTVLFNVTLSNQDNQQDAFVLSLGGPQGQWAHLASPPDVQLKGYEHATVRVAVKVPAGEPMGERGSILVKATNAADDSEIALLQLHAVVDDKPMNDEAALVASVESASAKHKTPAPGDALLVPALALAALALMRRRHA